MMFCRLEGIPHEARERLVQHRPATLGQAAKIQGVTAATLALLLRHVKQHTL